MAVTQTVVVPGLPTSAAGTSGTLDVSHYTAFSILAPGATDATKYAILLQVSGVDSPGANDWTTVAVDPTNGDFFYATWIGAARRARVKVVSYVAGNPVADGMQLVGVTNAV